MTAPTHKQYAVTFALLGAMLLPITSINYYLALVVLVTFSKIGGLFPDVDHSWDNVKEKTVINWVINKIIHLLGGKHRSWVTHSWDIALVFTGLSIWVPYYLNSLNSITVLDKEILTLILFGIALGWCSHLFSDMLTPAGVRLLCMSNFKMKLVPKKLFGYSFSTGTDWELFIQKLQKVINVLLGVVALLYPIIMNTALCSYLLTMLIV